jgi:hypothetical protein
MGMLVGRRQRGGGIAVDRVHVPMGHARGQRSEERHEPQ